MFWTWCRSSPSLYLLSSYYTIRAQVNSWCTWQSGWVSAYCTLVISRTFQTLSIYLAWLPCVSEQLVEEHAWPNYHKGMSKKNMVNINIVQVWGKFVVVASASIWDCCSVWWSSARNSVLVRRLNHFEDENTLWLASIRRYYEKRGTVFNIPSNMRQNVKCLFFHRSF